MGFDEHFRKQSRIEEQLGFQPSAIDQATKATRPLSAELGFMHGRSVVDQVTTGTRSIGDLAQARGSLLGDLASTAHRDALGLTAQAGAISSFLKSQDAFSTKALGAGVVATATAHAAREQHRLMGLATGRLGHDMLGFGSLATRASQIAFPIVIEAATRAHAAARASQWATTLDGRSTGAIADALKMSHGFADQIGQLTRTATGIVRAGDLIADATSVRALAGYSDATAIKLSTFGGSLDLFGPRAPVGQAAFDALFGTWRMRDDLPASFFRDPAARARAYRDAQVDAGLVDAANAEVIELLVQSGAVAGARTGRGTRAVVEIGLLRMTVTAGRARHDAFRAIDGFEVALRAFVGAKLAAHCHANGDDPEKWFTLRVPGNIVGDAKRTRRDAYKAGEDRQPLINFTNLGELITVIISGRNWDDVFGAVFSDRDGFKVDLQRLTANRRPAMHARPIDGPRLAEILLVIRRLMAMMESEGAWDAGWDDDY